MRISDWSSDVGSSDLAPRPILGESEGGGLSMTARVEFFFDLSSPWTCLAFHNLPGVLERTGPTAVYRPILVGGVFNEIGRASTRDRVCQYVYLSVVAVSFKKKLNNNTLQLQSTTTYQTLYT